MISLPILLLPLPIALDELSLPDAVAESGRRVVVSVQFDKPAYEWNGYTIVGCADHPDGIERGAMLVGERLIAADERILVVGKLKVVQHAPTVVNGVAVPVWSEIVVVEDPE